MKPAYNITQIIFIYIYLLLRIKIKKTKFGYFLRDRHLHQFLRIIDFVTHSFVQKINDVHKRIEIVRPFKNDSTIILITKLVSDNVTQVPIFSIHN